MKLDNLIQTRRTEKYLFSGMSVWCRHKKGEKNELLKNKLTLRFIGMQR